MPAATFSRSKGSRSPERFTTTSGDLLDALEGGEPAAAVDAGPPAADRGAVVGLARVDDLVVEGAAGRTAHASTLPAPADLRATGASRWPTWSGAPPLRSTSWSTVRRTSVPGCDARGRWTTACRRAGPRGPRRRRCRRRKRGHRRRRTWPGQRWPGGGPRPTARARTATTGGGGAGRPPAGPARAGARPPSSTRRAGRDGRPGPGGTVVGWRRRGRAGGRLRRSWWRSLLRGCDSRSGAGC